MTPTELYAHKRKLKKREYFRQYRAQRRLVGLDKSVRIDDKVTTEASYNRRD